MKPFKHFSIIIGGFFSLALLMGGVFLLLENNNNTHAAMVTISCSQSAVIAAEKGVPHILPSKSSNYIPAGEPNIVAKVNGQDITASELEANVVVISNNHKQVQHAAITDPNAQQELNMTDNQIRQTTLDRLINNKLLFQEAQKTGHVVPLSQVTKAMSVYIDKFNSMSINDPARIQFTAYLCANSLTEKTFLTNSAIVEAYQESMSVGIVRQINTRNLTPAQLRNSALVESTVSTYTQTLKKKAKIEIFVPSVLLK